MKRSDGNRARLGGVLLAAALAAAAILALPTIGLSKDGGGNHGPRAAGTIESFDPETGELVVDLAKGDTISGLVVRRTKIRCGAGRHHRGRRGASASRRRGGELGGDRGGRRPAPGEDNHADGDGDRGNDNRRGRCNRGDLVPGAVVKKAEIVLTHGNAFYRKIGLLPPQFGSPQAASTE